MGLQQAVKKSAAIIFDVTKISALCKKIFFSLSKIQAYIPLWPVKFLYITLPISETIEFWNSGSMEV